jgi:enolase-phosphatase E1
VAKPLKAVVCDIEGTTSSISFVHRVLFPLSAERLPEYLDKNFADSEVAAQLEVLWAKIQPQDSSDKKKTLLETLQEYIRKDVKDTTLKWVQGKIWQVAFESGQIKGHIYPEVADFFRRWTSQGLKLFIYSSGSVEAQKLMFRYSEAGNLAEYLSGYFDTMTGMKRETSSYEKIALATGNEPGEMLFLSDVVEELNAASAAGMQTCLLLREGATAPAGYSGAKSVDFKEVNAQFF